MHILVVGGAGYIGSHVCKALRLAGYIPVTLDNLSSGHRWAVQFGPIELRDVEDDLSDVFAKYQPKAVIHLASLINVRDSIENPAPFYEKNLLGTLNLLKAMLKAQVFPLVFSSTAAIYGMPLQVPIVETHPKAPLNAYGKTKWAIEGMLEDFSRAYGLRFVALRYFNACGADLTAQIGESHEPETHLIPSVIQTALGLRDQLAIFGTDYPTPDGTAIRDYVHVVDLANAHTQAVEYLLKGGGSVPLNLGTGRGYSVRQIIEEVSKLSGFPIPFQVFSRLEQDSPHLVADPSLAKKILNWSPAHSDLPTIISSAWRWQKKMLNRLLVANPI